MDLISLFSFKPNKQREQESRQYAQWAFPYGEPQREAVQKLLGELLPDEKSSLALAVFLIGRDAYRGHGEENDERTRDEKVESVVRVLGKQLPGGHRKKMPRYLALVLADEMIDESLCYPSVDDLRQTAQTLQEVCRKKRRWGMHTK